MRTPHWIAFSPWPLALSLVVGCSGDDGRVLGSVGRAQITRPEFERKLNDVAQEYQSYLMTPDGRRQFFNILVREKLILAAAQDSPVPQSREFRDELDRFETDQRERLREYREHLLSQMWREALRRDGTLAVSDGEVDSYYEQHPREVALRHILVSTPEEAKTVVQQLRAGASFKALAKTRSVDAETAASGGEVPPFIYGELLPELGDVAFAMKQGEIAGPVRSQFGYHIVKKETERRLPREKLRERIRRLLENKKLDQHLESLQPRYAVKIHDPQFR